MQKLITTKAQARDLEAELLAQLNVFPVRDAPPADTRRTPSVAIEEPPAPTIDAPPNEQ